MMPCQAIIFEVTVAVELLKPEMMKLYLFIFAGEMMKLLGQHCFDY